MSAIQSVRGQAHTARGALDTILIASITDLPVPHPRWIYDHVACELVAACKHRATSKHTATGATSDSTLDRAMRTLLHHWIGSGASAQRVVSPICEILMVCTSVGGRDDG